MASVLTGIVEGVNRASHELRVKALSSASGASLSAPEQKPTLYPKYRGDSPPPLSYVDLEQPHPGVWRLSGSGNVADRRLILREDFALSVRDGLGTLWADTVWRESGTGFAVADTTLAGAGIDALHSGGGLGTGNLTKENQSITLDAATAYWLSARVAHDAVTNMTVGTGFSNDRGSNLATVGMNTLVSSRELLVTASGASVTSTTIPFMPTVNAFYVIDLVLVPGEFAAAWIDGAGPYISVVTVPAAGVAVQPFLTITDLDGADHLLYIDWFRVELFQPAAHPLRDLGLPASGFVA